MKSIFSIKTFFINIFEIRRSRTTYRETKNKWLRRTTEMEIYKNPFNKVVLEVIRNYDISVKASALK